MSNKNDYLVRMPFTGIASVIVEASSEEEALELAKKQFDDVTLNGNFVGAEIDEWELTEQVVVGNVFYGCLNEMDVREI